MAKKRPITGKLDAGQLVREMARERVGRVPAAREIPPKTARKKPKHKKQTGQDEL